MKVGMIRLEQNRLSQMLLPVAMPSHVFERDAVIVVCAGIVRLQFQHPLPQRFGFCIASLLHVIERQRR